MKPAVIATAILFWLILAVGSYATVETFLTEGGGKTARNSAAVDSKGVLHRGNEYGNQPLPWLADRTKTVPTKYPYMERAHHHTGSGVFRMGLDLQSGSVTNVVVLKSTGFERLDREAVAALSQWRWKPGKWRQIDLPVTFTIGQPPTVPPKGVERIPGDER